MKNIPKGLENMKYVGLERFYKRRRAVERECKWGVFWLLTMWAIFLTFAGWLPIE